jgi:hypothetical protein
MPPIIQIDPQLLKDRHRFSPQEINHIFGFAVLKGDPQEKLFAMQKVKELLDITDAFTVAGIDFIPLKGPLLSYRIYKDPTFRNFRDLDILVERQAFDDALLALKRLGYQIEDVNWPDNNWLKKQWFKYFHHVSLYHPEKEIVVELHWRLLGNHSVDMKFLDTLVYSNSTRISFMGRSFRVLSNEMELLYLMIHGGIHSWARLKWLNDVVQFMDRQNIDEIKFRRLAEQLHAERLVGLYRILQEEYFPESRLIGSFPDPPRYMIRYPQAQINAQSYDAPESFKDVLKGIRYSMLSFTGLSFKLRSTPNYMISSIYFGIIGKLIGSPLKFLISLSGIIFKKQPPSIISIQE